MSGKRTKLLRKVFEALNPPGTRGRSTLWRNFKRDYTRSTRAQRKAFMDQ